MHVTRSLFAFVGAGLIAGAVPAAESYKMYDNFDAVGGLSAERWRPLELTRLIRDGRLIMSQRNIGNQTGSTGTVSWFHSSNLRDPQAITQLRATVRVDAADSDTCPANPQPGEAGAQIIGAFFNAGTSVPGTRFNDVMAFVRINKLSTAADPSELKVTGYVLQCTNNDCTTTSELAKKELGTSALGVPVLLTLIWDQPNKRFRFGFKTDPLVNAPYGIDDSLSPTLPFKTLQTLTRLPDCFDGPRANGYANAAFDSVWVNASAIP
ncbi:MAG: hypothetical protein HYZ20_11440 [Burkholderiales bacterium]|nr:hypothetical protein [Burkholderiales bacterium]